MKEDIILMSGRDLRRLSVIHQVIGGVLRQKEAGEAMGLSSRQVRRIVRRVEREGDRGIIHRLRGKASVRKISEETRRRAMRLYREHYDDFGPTLAQERLRERHRIEVSVETVRRWLLEEGLWSRSRRGIKHRSMRERKACFGQMLQMDGSHHDWLEGRGPKLVMMGYIDDATGKVFARFDDYEGTLPAMDGFRRYIRAYGIPQSVYLDRHSTYKSPREPESPWEREEQENGQAMSQFERAMKELGVQVIHAYSPQAKGRIERFFLTAQDPLVKEMRLADIRDKKQANAFLPGYLRRHNRRFCVAARESADLHRPVTAEIDLERIFCIKTVRSVCRDLTIQFQGRRYQLLSATAARKVHLRRTMTGKMLVTSPTGQRLSFKPIHHTIFKPIRKPPRLVSQPVPAADHPWRRFSPSFQRAIRPAAR